MAPNQTKLASIQESLSSLDLAKLTVKSEFLPLTHVKEQAAAAEVVLSNKPQPPTKTSDDYWSWTPSVEQETALECTSSSRMQELLLQDAQRRCSSIKEETVYAAVESTQDSYWDMPSETLTKEDPMTVQAQHEAYWEWPSSNDVIQGLSTKHIVDNLVKGARKTKTTPSDTTITTPTQHQEAVNYWDEAANTVIRATRTHASYWVWESTAKQELIDMLRKEDNARCLTSGRHISLNLEKASNDHYWGWNAATPVVSQSDYYWDWQAKPTHKVVTEPDSYWAW